MRLEFPDFGYLEEAVNRCPASRFTDDLIAYAAHISPDDLKVVRSTYEEIERRHDAPRLSTWIEDNNTTLSHRLFGLFCIFDLLANKGVSPFASRSVEYLAPIKPMKWSKLSDELKFLAPIAEKYGPIRSFEQIKRFVSQLDDHQRQELRAISNRLRTDALFVELCDWIDRYSCDEHPESNLLINLIQVLEAAGYPIEDEPDEGMIATKEE